MGLTPLEAAVKAEKLRRRGDPKPWSRSASEVEYEPLALDMLHPMVRSRVFETKLALYTRNKAYR